MHNGNAKIANLVEENTYKKEKKKKTRMRGE
jgi:hypothetical protein